MATFTDLPAELQLPILEAIRDAVTQADLASLVQCSKSVASILQPALYRHLALGGHGQSYCRRHKILALGLHQQRLLLRTFLGAPGLAALVREISVGDLSSDSEGDACQFPLSEDERSRAAALIPLQIQCRFVYGWARTLAERNHDSVVLLILCATPNVELLDLMEVKGQEHMAVCYGQNGAQIADLAPNVQNMSFTVSPGVPPSLEQAPNLCTLDSLTSLSVRIMKYPMGQTLALEEVEKVTTLNVQSHRLSVWQLRLIFPASFLASLQHLNFDVIPRLGKQGYVHGVVADTLDEPLGLIAENASKSLKSLCIRLRSLEADDQTTIAGVHTVTCLSRLSTLRHLELPWWMLKSRLEQRSDLAGLLPDTLDSLTLNCDWARRVPTGWTAVQQHAFIASCEERRHAILPSLTCIEIDRRRRDADGDAGERTHAARSN